MSLCIDGETARLCGERFAVRRFLEMSALSAQIEVEEDWITQTLPPPLEPTGSAVRVVTGRWNDEVVGTHTGGGLYVPAQVAGISGEFVLRLYVDSDLSVLVGREVFGEPKFLATEAALSRDGDACHGQVSRGMTRIAIDGHVDDLAPPAATTRRSFNLKAHANVDARSTFGTSLLTLTEWEQPEGRTSHGIGHVELDGALDQRSVPRKGAEPCEVTWSQGAMEARTRVVSLVEEEHALPIVLGRLGLDG